MPTAVSGYHCINLLVVTDIAVEMITLQV